VKFPCRTGDLADCVLVFSMCCSTVFLICFVCVDVMVSLLVLYVNPREGGNNCCDISLLVVTAVCVCMFARCVAGSVVLSALLCLVWLCCVCFCVQL
jgi:hypothetical protein